MLQLGRRRKEKKENIQRKQAKRRKREKEEKGIKRNWGMERGKLSEKKLNRESLKYGNLREKKPNEDKGEKDY